jgi:catechol 2,3-dioxygenase-like lactoylglutathione lyase family enzyme
LIAHVAFEVADLATSARFYDAVLHCLGGRRLRDGPGGIAYGRVDPVLWIVARERAPGPGYGHVALAASGRAAVDAAWAAGVAKGGSDDGAPGPRPSYGRTYYAAYLRDPDGLRVEVVSGAS